MKREAKSMKRIIFNTLACALAATCLLLASGCEKKLEPAQVEIIDPVRHYYPIVQGEQLSVSYEIENTSKEPLVIQEVQTTCGCLVPADLLPLVVLPNKTGRLNLTFDTTKNSGAVEHFIWLYGNFTDSTYRELKFDTNIVPPADYSRDYEQLYHERNHGTRTIKDMVDGLSSEKGYYTNSGDPREKVKEEFEAEVNSLAF